MPPGAAARDHVLIGRERNDVGRPHDEGYPARGIVKDGWAYVRNFEPGRWPCGNPETGYLDCDGGATKTDILAAHRKDPLDPHWALCFGMRPGEELYDLGHDPDCLHNLAADAEHTADVAAFRAQLDAELHQQHDPRIEGNGAIFDQYLHAQKGHVGFYERFMKGEKLETGWVTDSDFEASPGIPRRPK